MRLGICLGIGLLLTGTGTLNAESRRYHLRLHNLCTHGSSYVVCVEERRRPTENFGERKLCVLYKSSARAIHISVLCILIPISYIVYLYLNRRSARGLVRSQYLSLFPANVAFNSIYLNFSKPFLSRQSFSFDCPDIGIAHYTELSIAVQLLTRTVSKSQFHVGQPLTIINYYYYY